MSNYPILVSRNTVDESGLHIRSILHFLSEYLKPHLTKMKHKERNKRAYDSVVDISPEYQLDFKEVMSKQILFLLNEIGTLPNWFDKEEYVKRCWNNYVKYLERNREVKKYMLKLDRKDVTEIQQKLDTVFLAFSAISESMIKSYPQLHKTTMSEFLDSDLPFELFTLSNQSYLNKINAFDILQKNTDKFQSIIFRRRGNIRQVKKTAIEYENGLHPILQKMQKAIDSELLLKYYIKINNSNEMDDMFLTIPSKMEKLDKSRFMYSLDYFKEETNSFTEFLTKSYNRTLPAINNVDSLAIQEFNKDIGQILVNYV